MAFPSPTRRMVENLWPLRGTGGTTGTATAPGVSVAITDLGLTGTNDGVYKIKVWLINKSTTDVAVVWQDGQRLFAIPPNNSVGWEWVDMYNGDLTVKGNGDFEIFATKPTENASP